MFKIFFKVFFFSTYELVSNCLWLFPNYNEKMGKSFGYVLIPYMYINFIPYMYIHFSCVFKILSKLHHYYSFSLHCFGV